MPNRARARRRRRCACAARASARRGAPAARRAGSKRRSPAAGSGAGPLGTGPGTNRLGTNWHRIVTFPPRGATVLRGTLGGEGGGRDPTLGGGVPRAWGHGRLTPVAVLGQVLQELGFVGREEVVHLVRLAREEEVPHLRRVFGRLHRGQTRARDRRGRKSRALARVVRAVGLELRLADRLR